MRYEMILNWPLANYKIICKVISYEKVALFIKNKKAPNAVYICASNDRMQQYMYDHRREKSVSDLIKNEMSVATRKIMKEYVELPIKDGNSLLSIVHRIFESGFKDNPILFFKLINADNSAIYVRILKAIDTVVGVNGDDRKNKELEIIRKQISEAKAELEKTKSDFAKYYSNLMLNTVTQDFDIEKICNIESIQLYERNKTTSSYFSRDFSYPFTSICKVIDGSDKNSEFEKIRLKRLADIADDGTIIPYVNVRPFFGDPKDNYIFKYFEGPRSIETIGIWNWRTVKDRDDSSKTRIESSFCMGLPIEIIISTISFSFESFLQEINGGIEIAKQCVPFLYSIMVDNNNILGILLNSNNSSFDNGCIKINDNIFFLNIYLYSKEETIIFDDKRYYRNINLKNPIARYRLKSLNVIQEIIKGEIIKRATWSEFKRRGITSKEWSALKTFLSELPTTDVISVIASDCKCSVEEATEYYSQFVAQCDKYIDGKSIEDSFFTTLLDNHPDLRERCYRVASEQWQKQNSAMIDEANLAISDLNSQIEQRKLTLADTERLLSERKEEISELDVLFASKQKMAEDVERKIADKISKARKDAAEFISEMAFVSSAAPTVNSELSKKVRLISGTEIEKESIHEYRSTGILLDIIAAGLDTVGVTNAGNIQTEFAAFLYSAYTERIPLLLAGPCGSHIADALSTSLFGRTAAQIDCAGDVDDFDFTTITDNSDRIIVFNNALNGDWLNKIVAFSMNNGADKYCILTTPFSEDLAIEPKGILNYAVPFFTELIIAQKGKLNFFGGNPSDDFAAYNSADSKKYSHEMLSEIGLGFYTRNVFKQLLSNVAELIERKPAIDAFLYYAAAYITGKLDHFSDYVHDKLSDKEIKKILENYLGE